MKNRKVLFHPNSLQLRESVVFPPVIYKRSPIHPHSQPPLLPFPIYIQHQNSSMICDTFERKHSYVKPVLFMFISLYVMRFVAKQIAL